ncbi:MAG: glycerophosphodiester phosphodiesterase [Hyphomicrobiales bacterium]|nr:glycerophosphodiester phosphodiesterase [Hyphomicrobiales bacterium]
MSAFGWLVERPIAHRGLHGPATGAVENSLSAAAAAIAAGFAIECDIQLSADGEAIVFHDFTLDRLTGATGRLDALPASAMTAARFRAAPAEGPPTLRDLLALIDGRTPLVCEIKSEFTGDFRLTKRALAVAEAYRGPLAFKSFDPDPIAFLRERGAGGRPLGIVAEANYDDPHWAGLSAETRAGLAAFSHFTRTRPDFVSFNVNHLPAAAPQLCRDALGLPVMAWTVRTPELRARALRFADQIVFEGAGRP